MDTVVKKGVVVEAEEESLPVYHTGKVLNQQRNI